jgi:hypothetical protein
MIHVSKRQSLGTGDVIEFVDKVAVTIQDVGDELQQEIDAREASQKPQGSPAGIDRMSSGVS